MSWDVLLLRLPDSVRTISDLPDDFSGVSLGSPAEVASILRQMFPSIDLADPSWAVLVTDDYSIEFSIGEETPCTSVMLHVRGPETAIEPLRAVCERTGWRAFDTSTGDVIDFADDPAKGLRKWIAYRQKSGITGPLKGVSLPIDNKGAVVFDAPPQQSSVKKKKWWQLWH